MKFLITDSEGTQELLCVNKKKQRIRLKYHTGYTPSYIGKVACELQDNANELQINIEGKEYSLDYAEVDYLRKVLNAWHEHLSSPWLSEEQCKESIYKLKKGEI